MSIEIVWLAYDERRVRDAWQTQSIKELYFTVLEDEFRKKVDLRTMLFHKSQYYLLQNLEALMKQGAINLSLDDYMAHLFQNDIQSFPIAKDDVFLDFQLISYFTALRMADNETLVENVFTALFRKLGEIGPQQKFSLHRLKDIERFFDVLGRVTFEQVISIANDSVKQFDSKFTFDDVNRFLRNYIEFFNYAKNNDLKIFYYNNCTDIKYWGDLVERQNERSQRVVRLSFKEVKDKKDQAVF